MAIPNLFSITLPLLKVVSDGNEFSSKDIKPRLEKYFELTEDEKQQMLPSGNQSVFTNRVAWAIVELKLGGLLESPRRGIYKITKRGLEVLSMNPIKIDRKLLSSFLDYREKLNLNRKDVEMPVSDEEVQKTPDELIEIGYQRIRSELSVELLQRIKNASPKFFESLVIDLLIKMGYGGSKADRGTVTGKVGDEGIDGIIKEDPLGLDIIYIQAKKWDANVSRPEIQKFVGALQGQKANKGVFITTSQFTKDAIDYVSKVGANIVLISGYQLAELMIDYNIGVSVKQNYEIKKVDNDYFIEE